MLKLAEASSNAIESSGGGASCVAVATRILRMAKEENSCDILKLKKLKI